MQYMKLYKPLLLLFELIAAAVHFQAALSWVSIHFHDIIREVVSVATVLLLL